MGKTYKKNRLGTEKFHQQSEIRKKRKQIEKFQRKQDRAE